MAAARQTAAPPGPGFALRRPPRTRPGPAVGSRPGSSPGVARGASGPGNGVGVGGAEGGRWLLFAVTLAACGLPANALPPRPGRRGEKRPLARRLRAYRPGPCVTGCCGVRPRARLPGSPDALPSRGLQRCLGFGVCGMAVPRPRLYCGSKLSFPPSAQRALLFPYESVLRWHRRLQDLSRFCRPRVSLLPLSPITTRASRFFTCNMAEVVASAFYSADLDALGRSSPSFSCLPSELGSVCSPAFAPLNLGGLK